MYTAREVIINPSEVIVNPSVISSVSEFRFFFFETLPARLLCMPSRRRSARCAKSAPLTSLPTRRRPFRCCCRRLSRRDRLGVVDAGPSRPSRFIIDLRFAECAAPRRGGSELVGGGGFVTDVHLRSPVRQKACRRGPPAGRAARPAQGMPDMSERWRRGEAARPQRGPDILAESGP